MIWEKMERRTGTSSCWCRQARRRPARPGALRVELLRAPPQRARLHLVTDFPLRMDDERRGSSRPPSLHLAPRGGLAGSSRRAAPGQGPGLRPLSTVTSSRRLDPIHMSSPAPDSRSWSVRKGKRGQVRYFLRGAGLRDAAARASPLGLDALMLLAGEESIARSFLPQRRRAPLPADRSRRGQRQTA